MGRREIHLPVGARKAILNDLSPAATFIAYNYNLPVSIAKFKQEGVEIIREADHECGWMFDTCHPKYDSPKPIKGKINYTVW